MLGRVLSFVMFVMIQVNGHYATAAKQIRILKKTLFYRDWAREAPRQKWSSMPMNSGIS